ncbi:MAG: SprT family zinc-dependent metalloprotease [Candidatus Saccharimonas sp.]
MPFINDPEFGEIIVTKRVRSTHVRIRVDSDGQLAVTAPRYVAMPFIRKFVDSSRIKLRDMLKSSAKIDPYYDNQPIGKLHTLKIVKSGLSKDFTVKIIRQTIIVYLPPGNSIGEKRIQDEIRTKVARVLRTEAKAYLPVRLAHFAQVYGFSYDWTRFNHNSSRWGSCSSLGTISLNIALMKLPDELIDYVLIHELCHTKHMNHSKEFWASVERCDPDYKPHRKLIKQETPSI